MLGKRAPYSRHDYDCADIPWGVGTLDTIGCSEEGLTLY